MAAKTSKGKPKKEAPKSKKNSSKKKSAPAPEAKVTPPAEVAETNAPVQETPAPAAEKPAPDLAPAPPVAQPETKPAPPKKFVDFCALIKKHLDQTLGTRRRSVEEIMAWIKKGKEQYISTSYRIIPDGVEKGRIVITIQWGADTYDLPSYKLWVSGKK